jgi:hypothetical protein
MLDIYGRRRSARCDGIGRRDFLRVGSLAFGGLTLSNLLRSQALASGGRQPPEIVPAPKAKSGLLLWLPGGPSHFETWDPKPDAPFEIRGPYGSMPTKVPGLHISDLFPKLAAIADKFSIVRSCCHANSGHGGGERWVMTGYNSRSPEFELPHDYPRVGSVVAKMRGQNVPGMLPFVAVPPSNLHNNSAAYLGATYNPLELYSNGRQWEMQLDPLVKPERLAARRDLRASLDRIAHDIDRSGMMDAMDSLEAQALDVVLGGKAREAFDPEKEPAEFHERYGKHEWGKSCLLARRLIEAGTTFVTVSVGSWDQHGSAGGSIKEKYAEYAPQVDQAVSTLLTDLDDRGLHDETVIYLLGEFGRTPRVNNTGGRDHWPQAMSVLMTGGGLRRGQVVGATSPNGEHPIERTMGPADILATIYHQLGINYRTEFINGEGRPIKLLSEGEPIRELV